MKQSVLQQQYQTHTHIHVHTSIDEYMYYIHTQHDVYTLTIKGRYDYVCMLIALSCIQSLNVIHTKLLNNLIPITQYVN